MKWLRQSTASQEIQLGKFVDDTDFKTAETALSIANTDIKIWKEGATTQASKNSGGATHIANGWYYCVLDATDTNTCGMLEVTVDVSGALSVMRQFMVVPAMIYDSIILGTDDLDTNTKKWNDLSTVALPLVPTTAGRTLDVSATGEAGIDWANVGSPTTSVALTGTTIATTQKVDVETIKTQTVTCAAGVTVNPNIGTTQPINFTGTGSSALAKVDVIDWDSTAVATPNIPGYPKVDVVLTIGESVQTDNAGYFVVKLADAAHGGSSATITLDAFILTSGFEPTTNNAIAAAVVTAFSDDTGTAQAGASGTITLQSGASASNNYYTGAVVCLTGGTGAGQSRKITAYNGTTKVATVDSNWTTNPDNTTTYFVIGRIT